MGRRTLLANLLTIALAVLIITALALRFTEAGFLKRLRTTTFWHSVQPLDILRQVENKSAIKPKQAEIEVELLKNGPAQLDQHLSGLAVGIN